MSMLETIKSYLVSLGFSVDKTSFDDATKTIDSASQKLSKFAGETVKNFGVAGVTVATFLASAVVGISKFVMGLGEAQIKYEMLSRQLWTTQENAMAFDTTLKAMGVSLQDLYLSPTLMKQFQELHQQAFEMMPPGDFQKQMSLIQSITFEFKRLKLEGTYALQWIGYYFVKYMQGPLQNIKQVLQNINDTIIKTMPRWTKVVAEVMTWFFQLGGTVVQALTDIGKAFKAISDQIPNNVKVIGAALLGLGLAIKAGPIGIIVMALLLLDDFYTYLKGGQSQFAPLWKGLIGFYDKLKDSGAIKAFEKGFENVVNAISKGIKNAKKDVTDFFSTLQQNGTIKSIEQTLSNAFNIVGKVIQDVTSYTQTLFKTLNQSGVISSLGSDIMNLIKSTYDLAASFTGLINTILGMKSTNSVFKGIGDVLTNTILAALQTIDFLLKETISEMNVWTDIFQGKWAKAWKDFSSIITGKNLQPSTHQSYIYPNTNNNSNTNNNQKVTLNQTNNIYGSDPQSTAKAATNNLQDLIYRNVQGVIL